jgi:hypothetical protein
LDIFKDNIIPDKHNRKYLTVYGAIKVIKLFKKSINILGPSYVMSYILPKLEEILNRIEEESKYNKIGVKIRKTETNDSENMVVDQPLGSFPNISFSQQNNFASLNNNIPSSLFSESGGNIIKSSANIINESIVYKTKLDKSMIKADKECFYVYYALKVIIYSYIGISTYSIKLCLFFR